MNVIRRAGLFMVAAFLLAFSTASHARTEPYVEPQPIEVPAGLSASAVKEAIVRALAQRAWVPKEISATELEASHDRAGKHSMTVRILFNDKQVLLSYKNSFNLNYRQDGGGAVIHPTGNFWLRNLRADVVASIASAQIISK